MAVWISLWPFVKIFPIWYVWTRKNMATLKKGFFGASFMNVGDKVRPADKRNAFVRKGCFVLIRSLSTKDFVLYKSRQK
jgi:hypothetical protein